MKKFLLVVSLFAILHSKTQAQYDRGYISFQTFYDELSPYGAWIYSSQYGYVWSPDEGRYFKPYASNGDWAYTQFGWTWVSNYSWGWAPFHYGRWIYDDWRGWLWVPGYDWAPAWVAWGSYGGNYGWAPLAPGINVSMDFGWRAPSAWWTFVPGNRFGGTNWNRYTIKNNRDITINNITIINNVYNDRRQGNSSSWMRGPEARDVERVTNSRVRTMEIRDAGNPSADRLSNNQVTIYRPTVNRKAEARPRVVEDRNSNRQVNTFPANERENNVVRSARPVTQQPVAPATDTRRAPTVSNQPRPATPSQPAARPVTREIQPRVSAPAQESTRSSGDRARTSTAPRRSVQ